MVRFKSILTATALALMAATAKASEGLTFSLEHFVKGAVTEADYDDQYLLIGVGYLTCPEICPTTVMNMALALETLDDEGDTVTGLFITVDPNRDTAEDMDWYTTHFHERIDGLSGTKEQIAAVAKQLRAHYGYSFEGKPVYPPLPDDYEVFHSSYISLYSPQGELLDAFSFATNGEIIGNNLKKQVK